MHHLTKKKYLGMKEAGMTAEELKAEMLAGGIEETEAEALITEAYSDHSDQDGEKEKEKTAPKDDKAEKPVKATKTANSVYEEWKMDISHEGGEATLAKVKKIKDVKITDDRAARLNEQAMNRRVKYFLKQK